ncbi:MAG: NAD-dependent epimerase/dehydratase family protein [Planctomycetes bacterium]|nr:NAD-dependent epimerase/dehydratase family protein [Planctomycetota bacterium]
MKVLVTGGNGFLGSRIVERLIARGDDVTVFARSRNPKPETRNPCWVMGDIREAKTLTDAIATQDAIIHTAAKAGVWGKRDEYFGINLTGTRNVLAACQKQGVRKLIYTSTPSVVFGDKPLENADESTPYATRFLTHYVESKRLAEEEVLAANGVAGVATVAMRPHLIWGGGDPHLVPRVLARAKAGKLRRVGDGSNKVDITHVDDAADAHVLALDSKNKAAGKAYFIASETVNLWDWIGQVLKRAGLAPVVKSVSRATAYRAGAMMEFFYSLIGLRGEPPMTRFVAENLATSHYFNISSARRDLGYAPKRTGTAALDELFAKTVVETTV